MQEIETCYFRKSLAASSFTTRKKHFGEKKNKSERAQRANKNKLSSWILEYSSCARCSSSFILKSAVRVIRILEKTILLTYFIMLHFSFMFPLKRLQPSLLSLPSYLLLFFLQSPPPGTPSAVTAVTATDCEGHQNESSYHSHSND